MSFKKWIYFLESRHYAGATFLSLLQLASSLRCLMGLWALRQVDRPPQTIHGGILAGQI